MSPVHDTRLLQNLLKTEKDAQLSFNAWIKATASASAALSAWSVADSGDTQDLMDISVRISQLLSRCSTSQRDYIKALAAYRASLKDILERETSVKTVIRDREILVSRLIKLGNKKPADSALASHEDKVAEAQKELAACEAFLQDEEASLSSLKRTSFRESLAMRMKAMGELGRVMEESSHEAVEILSQLGESSDYPEFLSQARADDLSSIAGDSISPSHSASQALSQASSAGSVISEEVQIPHKNEADSLSAQPNGASTPPLQLQRGVSSQRPGMVQRDSTITVTSNRPQSSAPLAGPTSALLASIPTAPRPSTAGPSIVVPTAPPHVGTVGPDADSSDDEETRSLQAHFGGGGLGPRSSVYGTTPATTPGSPLASRLRKKTLSDGGSENGSRKRRGSFFGGLASLFRRKNNKSMLEDDDDDDSIRSPRFRPSHTATSSGWETRTDRNLRLARQDGGGGRGAGVGASVLGRSRQDSSSSDEFVPRNLVRVVNDPRARIKAMSDLGRSPSIATTTTVTKNRRAAGTNVAAKRASVAPTVTTTMSEREPSLRRTRKVKKAASDTGLRLRTSSPPSLLGSPIAAPTAYRTSTLFDEISPAPTIRKKVVEPKQTLVITATSDLSSPQLSSPMATVPSTPRLTRSGTVTSTGTAKRKKKERAPLQTVASLAAEPRTTPPTAEDLASTLPSARASMYASYPAMELSPTPTMSTSEDRPGKVPKSVNETIKRTRKESTKYGSQNWVAHPTLAMVGGPGHTADESLMAIVDRDHKGEAAKTSRTYANDLIAEANVAVGEDRAVRRPPKAAVTSTDAGGAGGGAHGGDANRESVVRRKSVRLAPGPSPPPAQSPPASVRSDTLSPPRHGILVNSHSASIPGNDEGSVAKVGPLSQSAGADAGASSGTAGGWTTRVSTGQGTAAEDSSDEDDEEAAYVAAKKALAKGTKGYRSVLTAEMKGKGKAE